MAILSQSVPLDLLGCPAGACREQAPPRTRSSWRALAASFAAGALAVSAIVTFSGAAAPGTARDDHAREAAAAEWAAFVRDQYPRELPPQWRWRIEPLRLDEMYGKQR